MFRIAMVVPTGIGASLGGYAGDAGIAARYLAGIADEILTHPNVVNAAPFNALPSNGLYIEGHALDRFFLKEWGFKKTQANRIALVIDRRCEAYLKLITNAVNATAVSMGLDVLGYCLTEIPLVLELKQNGWGYGGCVEAWEHLLEACQRALHKGATALAVLTWMDILPEEALQNYAQGRGVDPIGSLEATLSHSLVSTLKIPVAHSPIFHPSIETQILDPRVAAEEIGTSYLPCVLMGLSKAPQYVPYSQGHCLLEDINALILPKSCAGGIPALSAAEHNIPIISIAENTTVLQVELEDLGWSNATHYLVNNMWEAGGLLNALKQGIKPELLRRPLAPFFTPIN